MAGKTKKRAKKKSPNRATNEKRSVGVKEMAKNAAPKRATNVAKKAATKRGPKRATNIAKKAVTGTRLKKVASKRSSNGKAAKVAKKPGKAVSQSSGMASAAEKIERKIASLGDWRGERLAEIRQLIHEVDPEVIEEWKWMGTPVWSHEGMYANANPFKDKVKITFHHGAQLHDPGKLFNAGLDGNKWRAIDFREGDKINKPKFKALLREAIAYNRTHTVPKSKGSRL